MSTIAITSAESVPRESPLMTAWPTIGATAAGRLVGRLSGLSLGYGFFTLGKLMALATIPLSLAVFCWQLMPYICRRYALTSRRIIVQKGLQAVEGQSIGLDEFDEIAIEIRPGQDWLHAGDVVFQQAGREVLRLSGVSRPEIFRQVCLKARTAMVSFGSLHQAQAPVPAPPTTTA
jgi:hypothetical protein